MKKIKVNRILMDVDGTMTWYLPQPQKHASMMECLQKLLMDKYDIDEKSAVDKICACGDPDLQCLSEFLPELGIDPEIYFEMCRSEYAKTIYIPEDTVFFLKKMKAAGIPVCTATTNPIFTTLIKMSLGGLADINGSPYISAFHPGCEFNDPKGKFSENYFPNILEKHKYDTETLMMLGDEVEHDFFPAQKAGIRHAVIIDRNQKEPLIEKDGGIFISNLKTLVDLII